MYIINYYWTKKTNKDTINIYDTYNQWQKWNPQVHMPACFISWVLLINTRLGNSIDQWLKGVEISNKIKEELLTMDVQQDEDHDYQPHDRAVCTPKKIFVISN